jgi:hypothetical protein
MPDIDIVRRSAGGTGPWKTEPERAASGGSQTGVSVVDYLFTEQATAGVYTAPPLTLPASSYIVDIQWWTTGDFDWAADTAVLDVSDTAIGSLISAQDVKGGGAFTPVSAAETVFFAHAYLFDNFNATDPSEATITVTITTTIAVPPVTPGGPMIVRVIYVSAPTPLPAVFA